MKLQVKAFLFMITLTGIFFIIYYSLSLVEKQKTADILRERKKEKFQSLNRSLQSSSKALEIFSQDYSVWGEMVEFVKTKNKEWAKVNIDESLPTFNANAAWVFNDKLDQIYSVNNLNSNSLVSFPLSKNVVKTLTEKNWISNFFIIIENVLFEVHYAPIQPSEDTERKTTPRGFFFVSRKWNGQILNELGVQSVSAVSLEKHTSDNKTGSQQQEFRTIVKKALNSWDGKPFIDVVSVSDFKILKRSSELYHQQMAVLFIFSLIILICTYIFLTKYIVRPINMISNSLEEQNPASLRTLAKKKDEFGKLSQLIMNFFSQKLQLMVEIQQRKDAESEISKNEEIYKRIFENIEDIYFTTDLEGTLILVSPSAERNTGFKTTEIIGKKIYEFNGNKELWDNVLDNLKKNNSIKDHEFEFDFLTKQNKTVHYYGNIHLMYDEFHKLIGTEGFIRVVKTP